MSVDFTARVVYGYCIPEEVIIEAEAKYKDVSPEWHIVEDELMYSNYYVGGGDALIGIVLESIDQGEIGELEPMQVLKEDIEPIQKIYELYFKEFLGEQPMKRYLQLCVW